MKKRVLSLILCLLILVSAFSLSVFAGSYADEYKVKEVWIYDVRLPYAEYHPDYDFIIRSSAYTFDTDRTDDEGVYNGCWWYDKTDEKVMDYDDPFVKGHTYKLNIFLEVNEGYEFLTDFKAYIDGNEAIVDYNLTNKYSACVEYTFAPSDYNMEVESVKLTVTEPVAGKCPTFSAETDRTAVEIGTMASPHYIEGVAWYDCDNHVFLDPSDKFRENGNYEVYVVIKATGDFYFSTNGNRSDVNAKVNGNDAEVGFSGEDLNHHLLVTYVFGEKFTEVSKVEIRNLTVPADGANPDFELTPFAAEAYYINNVYWADYTNSGSPVTMKETDTFEAGHTYYLEVWLRTNDGYKFRIDDDEYIDISAYIGSEQAEVSSAGTETAAIIYMEFMVPESRVISEVDVINVDTPYAGRTPDYDAFCITRGCNVSSVKWYDVTDGNYELMAEDDAFIAGHIYRVNVMVEAEGDYTFLMVDRYNEAWGYINGIKAIAAAADEDTWLQLGLVFSPCGEAPDTEPTETTKPTETAEATEPSTGTEETPTDSTEPSTGNEPLVPTEPSTGVDTKPTDPAEPSTNDEPTKPTAPAEPSTNDEPTKPTDITKPSEPAGDKGILGDVNDDGKVNIKDVTLIQKYAAKLISFTDAEFIRADVTADSKVNIKDATAIQKYIAKIKTGYPIGKVIL